jgi:inorganic triphosphatase YgiF
MTCPHGRSSPHPPQGLDGCFSHPEMTGRGDTGRMSTAAAGSGDRSSASGLPVSAEIERKLDVDPGFRLPDLSGVPAVGSVAPADVHHLDATYFDTADLRLAANKITLRRRTGGPDAGWHLKLPRTDGERDEVHAPLGAGTEPVPAALRVLVEAHLLGADLLPAVRLVTARTVTRLLAADGAVLAEVAQDEVTATRSDRGGGGGAPQVWQEVEVELVGGDRDLLAAAVECLERAGARPSPSASKLARALGDRAPAG